MADQFDESAARPASAGHQLGQLVGDWFQDYFVVPLLEEVAGRLKLYLDHRNRHRAVRGEKIVWNDEDGNGTDYDFVMELGGTDSVRGNPVAFMECFWRRGSRHSKDKARDDSGKLMPMRHVYPTARFLGIIASGDFTKPARELINSRNIDLFYISKQMVIRTFADLGMVMDYADKSPEAEKLRIGESFKRALTDERKREAAVRLRGLLGQVAVTGYVDKVYGALSALPVEICFIAQNNSARAEFGSIAAATEFLKNPQFNFSSATQSFIYRIVYSDGYDFERSVESLGGLRELHNEIVVLENHLAALRNL
jgi:hypothetical protein